MLSDKKRALEVLNSMCLTYRKEHGWTVEYAIARAWLDAQEADKGPQPAQITGQWTGQWVEVVIRTMVDGLQVKEEIVWQSRRGDEQP